MDTIKSVSLLVLFTLLNGCIQYPTVLKPPTGDIVSIKHLSKSDWSPKLVVYQDDYDCYGIEPQAPSREADELLIERKLYTTVALSWTTAGLPRCNLVFTLLTGDIDEFALISEASSEDCTVAVYQREAEGFVKIESDRLYQRRFIPTLVESAPHCVADVSFQGSSLFVDPR